MPEKLFDELDEMFDAITITLISINWKLKNADNYI